MKENSIEEDIKIINNFITYFNKNIQNGNKADLTVLGEEINAIDHILSAYKRVLKENETLKKLLQGNLYEMYKYYRNLANSYQGNCISKEKVKEKIEELNKKEKEELKGMKGQDRYFVKQTYQNKKMILQELIKESEE